MVKIVVKQIYDTINLFNYVTFQLQPLLASIAPKHHPEMVKMILKAAAILHLHLAPPQQEPDIYPV